MELLNDSQSSVKRNKTDAISPPSKGVVRKNFVGKVPMELAKSPYLALQYINRHTEIDVFTQVSVSTNRARRDNLISDRHWKGGLAPEKQGRLPQAYMLKGPSELKLIGEEMMTPALNILRRYIEPLADEEDSYVLEIGKAIRYRPTRPDENHIHADGLDESA
jgi:hypothetical protein